MNDNVPQRGVHDLLGTDAPIYIHAYCTVGEAACWARCSKTCARLMDLSRLGDWAAMYRASWPDDGTHVHLLEGNFATSWHKRCIRRYQMEKTYRAVAVAPSITTAVWRLVKNISPFLAGGKEARHIQRFKNGGLLVTAARREEKEVWMSTGGSLDNGDIWLASPGRVVSIGGADSLVCSEFVGAAEEKSTRIPSFPVFMTLCAEQTGSSSTVPSISLWGVGWDMSIRRLCWMEYPPSGIHPPLHITTTVKHALAVDEARANLILWDLDHPMNPPLVATMDTSAATRLGAGAFYVVYKTRTPHDLEWAGTTYVYTIRVFSMSGLCDFPVVGNILSMQKHMQREVHLHADFEPIQIAVLRDYVLIGATHTRAFNEKRHVCRLYWFKRAGAPAVIVPAMLASRDFKLHCENPILLTYGPTNRFVWLFPMDGSVPGATRLLAMAFGHIAAPDHASLFFTPHVQISAPGDCGGVYSSFWMDMVGCHALTATGGVYRLGVKIEPLSE